VRCIQLASLWGKQISARECVSSREIILMNASVEYLEIDGVEQDVMKTNKVYAIHDLILLTTACVCIASGMDG